MKGFILIRLSGLGQGEFEVILCSLGTAPKGRNEDLFIRFIGVTDIIYCFSYRILSIFLPEYTAHHRLEIVLIHYGECGFGGYVGTYPVLATLVQVSRRGFASFGCIGSLLKTLSAITGRKCFVIDVLVKGFTE